MGNGSVTKYKYPDLSAKNWQAFARGQNGGVFKTAIQNYCKKHPEHKILENNADEVIKNIGTGKTIRIRDATKGDMVAFATALVDMIQALYIGSLNYPDRGKANLRGAPKIDVNVRGSRVFIRYNKDDLRRPSLMNYYSGGEWGRRGRNRIGKGLKDIYSYVAKGQKSKPRGVIGFWTMASQKYASVTYDPVVIGNKSARVGTDFVVDAVNRVFNDARFAKLSEIRVYIPAAWSKSGWTMYDKSNNSWTSAILAPEDVEHQTKSESKFAHVYNTGLKL